jgi:hypothetical protein
MEAVRRLAWFLALLAVACGGGDEPIVFVGDLGVPTQAAFRGNVPLIGASIDGRAVVMLTDSGAPITILDSTAFPGEEDGERPIDLEAFGLSFPDFPAVQFDLFGTAPAEEQAILGGDLLASFAYTLDYRGRRVWLTEPFDPGAQPGDISVDPEVAVEAELLGGGAALIPGGGGTVDLRATRFLVSARLEGQTEEVLLLVDTGASALVLDEEYLESLGQSPPRPRLDGVNVGTVDGSEPAYFTRVWRVTMGEVATDDVTVLVLPGTTLIAGLSREVDRPVVGLIGGSLLRRYLTTLDYPGRRLRLARYTDQSHVPTEEFVGPGFSLDVAGGVWSVTESYPGKDAYLDGLRVGDVIVSLGGTAIEGQSQTFVENLLRMYELGMDIPVGVRRGQSVETLQVRVENLLPSYPPP